MNAYEIADMESRRSVGVLLHFPKEDAYVVELEEWLDEWSAPLLFAALVKKGIYTIPGDISRMWVEERVIPCGRQNIGDILRTHKLESYDTMRFLEIAQGKCSQDSLYIRKISELPNYVEERARKNLVECMVCEDGALLCFFAEGSVRKVVLEALLASEARSGLATHPHLNSEIRKIMGNRALLESACIGVGGYSACFGGVIDIPARLLFEEGKPIPLSLSDFTRFVRKNVLDSAGACAELECSRQNLAYLQRTGLSPVWENARGNLYLKGDILRTRW